MAIRHLHDLSVVGNVTVATTGVTNNVLLTSTDTSSASAPDLVLYRNALIADSDTLGVLEFQGRNGMVTSSTAPLTYGAIYARVFDASENHTGLTFSANKGNGSGAFVHAVNVSLKGTNNSAEGAMLINPSTEFELPDSNLEVKGSYGITTESHGSSANWKQAYDNHITGIGVTGTSTKTITLTQRDGGTISANFSDQSGSGGIDMTNGSNNRVVTAVDSDTVNGEAGLLFGGSYLEITPGNVATPLQVKRTSASTRQVNLMFSANDGSSTSEGFLGIDNGADLRYGAGANTAGNSLILTEDNTSFVVNSSTNNAIIRLAAGGTNFANFNIGGLAGAITVNASSNSVTIGHHDTSSTSSVNNSNGTVIQDVTLDTYGHVTGLGSVNLDNRYVHKAGGTFEGDITIEGLIQADDGFSSDGVSPFHSWRALQNTSNSSNQYYRIATISGSQSSRFIIELAGRSSSYSDGTLPAFGKIVGQLNNDNNYDIVYYNASATDEVVDEVGQVDSGTYATDIYVRVGQFAELTATAHISDGSITPYDSNSGSTSAPTGYVQATEYKLWNQGNDGANSGLDADLLDGVQGSSYLRSDTTDTFTNLVGGTLEFDKLVYDWTSGTKVPIIELKNATSYGIFYHEGSPDQMLFSTSGNTDYELAFSSSGITHRGNTIWHAGNDGPNSGLNADLLDGQHASAFLTSESDTLATVTGRGASTTTSCTFNTITMNTPVVGSSNKIKFANNDYIRFDDTANIFHFDVDGSTSNASVQASTFIGNLSGNATTSTSTSRLTAVDDRDVKPTATGIVSGVKAIKPFFTTFNGMTGSQGGAYLDMIALDTYSDSSAGGPSAITFHKGESVGSPKMYIWKGAWNGSTWGTGQRVFADNYHPNADAWTTSRTITLAGDLSGSVSIDGSANVTLTATVNDDSHDLTWANIDGETANSVNGWGGLRHQTNDGYIDFGPANTSHAHIYTDRPNFYFNKELRVNNQQVFHTGYHPNADTLTTARTLTIGSTGKTFNGGANVSWTLSEIGAAASSHNHDDRYYTETESDAKYLLNTTDVLNGELNVTRNSGTTGSNAPGYSSANIELQTSSNHVPAISFHRGGYSATTLYEYNGELYVNPWTTRAQDGKLLSSGNFDDYVTSTYINNLTIDADTLGGQNGSYYLNYNNFSNTPTIPSTADFLSKTYSSNWTRLGYGTSGSAYWHRLAQVTINGSYKDYLLKIKWTSRYNHGELAIHIHSDNDTTADVWDATMRQFGESNTKSINDFKYIQSGSNVQVWVRTPGWREFDYIRQDAVTEGTPTINWYKEGDSGASKQTSDPGGTVFTDHTPWSPMNDGSGSGLDADLLDGMQPKSATGAAGSNQILRTHSNGYLYLQNWIDVGGSGLYSTTTNGAHLYPNASSDYGAWRMNGTRNGWNGITFDVSGTNVTLMASSTRMGFYNDADNEWMIDCNRNGSVDLYYDGVKKLNTRSNGIDIAGGIYSTGSWNYTNGSYGTQSIGYYYGAAYWYNTALSYYVGSLTGTSSSVNRLHVKGSIGVGSASASTTWGKIDASNDIVAYSSDKRLKENILPINGALGKISKLSGFTYNWNDKAKEEADFNTNERLVGVFAQDVKEVLPEAVKLAPFDNDGSDVSKSGENYLTVQYEKIVPLLIEGMKEQQAQIDELTTILEKLTKQLNNGNNI